MRQIGQKMANSRLLFQALYGGNCWIEGKSMGMGQPHSINSYCNSILM